MTFLADLIMSARSKSLWAILAVTAAVFQCSTTADASKRCGTVRFDSDRLVVRVVSGPVTCKEAMKVARLVSTGRSRVGKWTCDGGAGGIGCAKSRPRARITMLIA